MLQTQKKSLLHSLLEEGQPPGLADDEIGPLHDDDGHEESCVTRVLQLLPLGVGLVRSISTVSLLIGVLSPVNH